MHNLGWVANHEGNITARLGNTKFLSTPTAISKGDIKENDLLVIDEACKVLEGTRKVFSEIGIHLCVYKERDDVMAVLHAHPPYATAFAVSRIPVSRPVTAEFIVSIGALVPIVEFALPSSKEIEKNIVKNLPDNDVLLLANHGALSFGRTVKEAFLRMEQLESQAKIISISKSLGRTHAIDETYMKELLEIRAKAGLGQKGREMATKTKREESTDIVERIVREEVKKHLS